MHEQQEEVTHLQPDNIEAVQAARKAGIYLFVSRDARCLLPGVDMQV